MTNPANWMGDAYNSIKDTPISGLVLPGTHDSGAYKVSAVTPAIESASSGWTGFAMQVAARFLSWSDVSSKAFVQTQTADIGQQLEQGARLLDFRLGKGTDGKLYLSHTFLGEDLDKALTLVKDFMDKHPKEVVVVNLKKDQAFSESLSYDDQKQALKMINDILGEHMNKNASTASTVGELIANNGRVLFYSGLDPGAGEHGAVKNMLNHEVWPNKVDAQEVIGALQEKISDLSYYGNHMINYTSLNTTPDAKKSIGNLMQSFASKWLFWQKDFGLTSEGSAIQEEHGSRLLKLIENKNISGITLDSLSPKYIKEIIEENYNRIKFKFEAASKVNVEEQKNSDSSDAAVIKESAENKLKDMSEVDKIASTEQVQAKQSEYLDSYDKFKISGDQNSVESHDQGTDALYKTGESWLDNNHKHY